MYTNMTVFRTLIQADTEAKGERWREDFLLPELKLIYEDPNGVFSSTWRGGPEGRGDLLRFAEDKRTRMVCVCVLTSACR